MPTSKNQAQKASCMDTQDIRSSPRSLLSPLVANSPQFLVRPRGEWHQVLVRVQLLSTHTLACQRSSCTDRVAQHTCRTADL